MWALLPLKGRCGVFIDDLRTVPVLIQIPSPNNSSVHYGTGVYLYNSNSVFFVTAAHCLFDFSSTNFTQLMGSNALLTSLVRGTNLNNRSLLSVNLDNCLRDGLIKRHLIHDIAVIKLGSCKTITNSVLKLTTYRTDLVSFPTSNSDFVMGNITDICKSFNDVSEGSDSYVMGYPVSLISSRTGEIDFSAPLIRRGIISQKNQITKKLIIDSAVFGGNSGGPVLTEENPSLTETKFQLVGIITQYVPIITTVDLSLGVTNTALVNSGYGVAEPIDYALELIEQFPN